jgi:hypothetical protein
MQDVLANAKSDLQRCPAYYYAGARCLTLGKKVEARTLYDACLAISSDCLERTLAEIERKSVADAV